MLFLIVVWHIVLSIFCSLVIPCRLRVHLLLHGFLPRLVEYRLSRREKYDSSLLFILFDAVPPLNRCFHSLNGLRWFLPQNSHRRPDHVTFSSEVFALGCVNARDSVEGFHFTCHEIGWASPDILHVPLDQISKERPTVVIHSSSSGGVRSRGVFTSLECWELGSLKIVFLSQLCTLSRFSHFSHTSLYSLFSTCGYRPHGSRWTGISAEPFGDLHLTWR